MAQRFWRGADPVGGRLQVNGRWLQVTGVAKNSKYSTLREPPKPYFYTPLRQSATGDQTIQIRTRLGPETVANALTGEAKALDASLAPTEVITMRDQVDRTSWSQRAAVSLLTALCVVALLLAGVGLYGVMSYAVSHSTPELGLRMALGAEALDLLRIVVSHCLTLTLGGIRRDGDRRTRRVRFGGHPGHSHRPLRALRGV
jgi:putative ABC transport system permease protein